MAFNDYLPWSENCTIFIDTVETILDFSKSYNKPLTWFQAFTIYRNSRTGQAFCQINSYEWHFIVSLFGIQLINPDASFKELVNLWQNKAVKAVETTILYDANSLENIIIDI